MPVLCATENFVLQTRGPGRRPPCSGRLRSDDENFEGFTKFGGLSCSLHRVIDIAKERHLVICNHRWLRS